MNGRDPFDQLHFHRQKLMKASRLALACVLALLACSPGQRSNDVAQPRIPSDPPLMRGRVTRVDAARVRVEENPAEQTGSAKAELDIDARTAILARDGSPAPSLRTGQTVSVWTAGPVRETYPLRGTAATIIIETEP